VKGILYGVGVGPGDPELLTLKAVRVMHECTVIAAPDSGAGETVALRIAQEHIRGKEVLLCKLPMTKDEVELAESRRKAAGKLCGQLEQGKDVAFLTLGDPSVYATYSYLHRLVVEAGYQAVMVPGITSFCAAAATLGEPLCEGDEPLHILPAAYPALERELDTEGCKVLMKMGKSLDQTLSLLNSKGLTGNASLVERCTMPEEKVYRDIAGSRPQAGYFSVVIVRRDC